MNEKLLLESTALDLKRVALGLHSNSNKMTQRFIQEIIKRRDVFDQSQLDKTIKNVVAKMFLKLEDPELQFRSDDALLYSTILLSFAKRLQA